VRARGLGRLIAPLQHSSLSGRALVSGPGFEAERTGVQRPMAALQKPGMVTERDFGRLRAARDHLPCGGLRVPCRLHHYIIGETDLPNVPAVSTAALMVPLLAFYLFGGVLPHHPVTDHHGFH
jgi:hypothetical protein